MKHMLITFAILLLVISCDNDEQNSPNQKTSDPYPTDIGTPIGVLVTKEIDSSGGTLSSNDGTLDVIVPAGAVSSNTIFSVQSISNFCPGGKNAYRLHPDGPNFNSPVKLVFHYIDEDIGGDATELLGIAYQAPDNVWYTLPDAEVNTTNKTISVEVKHFTDWTAIEYLGIFPKIPELPELRVNTTNELSVYGQGMATEEDDLPPLPRSPNPNNNPSPGEDELPPLPVPRPFKTKWFVNGVENGNDRVGKISAGNAVSHSVIYTAPPTVPDDGIVLVSAEITGLKKWTIEGGKPKVKKYNKVILFKRIKIIPNEYDYTLRIEYKGDFACGFQGQIYNDVTTMDVHVKGEDVTIKNVVNQEPTVTPPSISFSGCTMHCDPGTIGTLNVVSGSGNVIPPPHSGAQWKFSLLLKHVALATGSSHKLECADADPIISNGEPYEAAQPLAFILKDSVQTSNTSQGEFGTFVKLTPK